MEKRVTRTYRVEGGEHPPHHQPWHVVIRHERPTIHNGTTFVKLDDKKFLIGNDTKQYDTLKEALDELKTRFDSIIQTGYNESYYFERNITIK